MCCLDIYVRPGLEGKVNKRMGRAGKKWGEGRYEVDRESLPVTPIPIFREKGRMTRGHV